MSDKKTCAIASAIEVGSIVEIDFSLVCMNGHRKPGFYEVQFIDYCDHAGNESYAKGCGSCKGYISIRSMDTGKTYPPSCFGYCHTDNIFPFKSIKGNDLLDSEFDDLLNML